MTAQKEPEKNRIWKPPFFWSMGSTVQMEITTGLTTEYLANLCAFPVTVHVNEEEIVLETEEDLEELGLDALYTDGLLEAVKNLRYRETEDPEWPDGGGR